MEMKKILALTLALCLVLGLAACGSKDTSAPAAPDAAEPAPAPAAPDADAEYTLASSIIKFLTVALLILPKSPTE